MRKLKWTRDAQQKYLEIIEIVEKEFGERSALKFIDLVKKKGRFMVVLPYMYRKIDGKTDIRACVVKRNTLIIYRINQGTIEILLLWDTRQNPAQFPIL